MISLHGIFSTDAGQLSDRLKSFARQNKYLQDYRHLCCQNIIFFAKVHRIFVRQTKSFCRTKWKFAGFVRQSCTFREDWVLKIWYVALSDGPLPSLVKPRSQGPRCSSPSGGGRVERRCWVNFQCRGVLLVWMIVGQGPIALAVGAGRGVFVIYLFSFLSPSLWETARYRLKYCLKGPLNPKQPTNQPIFSFWTTGLWCLKFGM